MESAPSRKAEGGIWLPPEEVCVEMRPKQTSRNPLQPGDKGDCHAVPGLGVGEDSCLLLPTTDLCHPL